MDNYKNYYFDRLGTTGASVEDNVGDFGDVEDRLSLRKSLQCKNFEALFLDGEKRERCRWET